MPSRKSRACWRVSEKPLPAVQEKQTVYDETLWHLSGIMPLRSTSPSDTKGKAAQAYEESREAVEEARSAGYYVPLSPASTSACSSRSRTRSVSAQ